MCVGVAWYDAGVWGTGAFCTQSRSHMAQVGTKAHARPSTCVCFAGVVQELRALKKMDSSLAVRGEVRRAVGPGLAGGPLWGALGWGWEWAWGSSRVHQSPPESRPPGSCQRHAV